MTNNPLNVRTFLIIIMFTLMMATGLAASRPINDLDITLAVDTQLVLGVDRDTSEIVHLFDERNLAVKLQIRQLVQTAHQAGKKVGICGQAPSDYPEFAAFLIQEGIDSISLNPDSVIGVKKRIAAEEARRSSAR